MGERKVYVHIEQCRANNKAQLLGVNRASGALAVSALAVGSAHFDVGGVYKHSEVKCLNSWI